MLRLTWKILLKSFVSKPNGNLGQVNETYELDYDAIKTAHQHLKAPDRIPAYRKTEGLISTICLRCFMRHLNRSGNVSGLIVTSIGSRRIVMFSPMRVIDMKPVLLEVTTIS